MKYQTVDQVNEANYFERDTTS